MYARLQGEMESKGFSRRLPAQDGIDYQLPTGEFIFVCDSCDGADVRKLAADAASAITDAFSIFIWDGQRWWARGLAKARAAGSET